MSIQQQQPAAKKSVSARTIILLVAVVLVTILAVQNWKPVDVWPLGNAKPLTLVIGIAFLLGAVIGWVGHSLIGSRRNLAPDHAVMDRDR